jgi:hypothetical protein
VQPSGYRHEMPDLSYNNNMKGWGPELCERRPDITMAQVDAFLTDMYHGDRADFVYTVSRDFVRQCQTPVLVLPDDVPGHPYIVAMESVYLALNAQVTPIPVEGEPQADPDRAPTRARVPQGKPPGRGGTAVRCRCQVARRGVGFGPPATPRVAPGVPANSIAKHQKPVLRAYTAPRAAPLISGVATDWPGDMKSSIRRDG